MATFQVCLVANCYPDKRLDFDLRVLIVRKRGSRYSQELRLALTESL